MAEFYENYDEDEQIPEIQGITDKVTDYTYAKLLFPCIVLKDGIKLEKHKVMVLSNMVKSDTLGYEKDISLYLSNGSELYKLGMVGGIQVSPLIDIVGVDNIVAYLSKEKQLLGSMIYSLCTV